MPEMNNQSAGHQSTFGAEKSNDRHCHYRCHCNFSLLSPCKSSVDVIVIVVVCIKYIGYGLYQKPNKMPPIKSNPD